MKNIRHQTRGIPQLGERVYVDTAAAIIGDVHIGDDCSIWPMSVIRGDVNQITIGERCSIQDASVLHVTHAGPHTGAGWPLIIGNDVTVGHRVVLHGCQLGNEILVGIGSIVMDGAIVEDQVVIGANSLIAPGKKLLSGNLYLGSPARKVRSLTQQELDYFRYTAANYVRLKDEYLTAKH